MIDEAVTPDCINTGLTAGKHCSVCSEVLVKQESVEALGHTAADVVKENEISATCTADGSYDEVVYCSECGDEISREAKTVSTLGHTKGEAVRENELPATCVKEGSCDEVVYCSSCGDELSRESKILSKLETHNYVSGICSVCGLEKFSEGLVFVSNGDKTCYVAGRGTCEDKDIVIPSVSPDGDRVIAIGENAFEYCTGIKSVTIPHSITSIGKYAFYYCNALEAIYYNATQLNDLSAYNYVFYNAGSDGNGIKVVIGKNVTKIPAYLFYPNSDSFASSYLPKITSVEFEEGSVCESIGGGAFYGCEGLESLILPDSVTTIGGSAFKNCRGLTNIEFSDNLTSIAGYAFSCCIGLVNVTIPDNVISIGNYAFEYCSGIRSFTIGNKVETIGQNVFQYCVGLTSLTIPESVITINKQAFLGCFKLVEIINRSSLDITAGGSGYGFVGSYAKEVHEGESKIVNYNDYLFYSSGGVNYLFDYIGNDTVLALPEYYNGEKYEINQYAFYKHDDITSVVIPDSITSIGTYAFASCTELTSVTIGNGAKSIGSYAFVSCTGLKSVKIGSSVTSIGSYAFNSCSSLTSVTFENPAGWWYSSSADATSGTSISQSDLSKALTAADYLKLYYSNSYWKRS